MVSSETGSALTVTPTADTNGYKTYKVAVNVDDTENAPIKVVDNKIKIATYKIAKVADASMEKDGEETKYASEYQLMMTSPDGTTTQVGDKINIAKDFFVKSAHVCTFNYASTGEGATKITEDLGKKEVFDKYVYTVGKPIYGKVIEKTGSITEKVCKGYDYYRTTTTSTKVYAVKTGSNDGWKYYGMTKPLKE